MNRIAAPLLTFAMLWSGPAAAKVVDQSAIGFTVAHTAHVAASPDDVWDMLRMPQKWWSKDHSWSGNAENFWLDAQAGGCFCEKLPGEGTRFGSVQHARIIFAKPPHMMRLSGALGPLQGEAVTGTLTIQIQPEATGSLIRFDYVVGGYMRFAVDAIAPGVDDVMGAQLAGLASALGGALPVDAPSEAGAASDLGSAVKGLDPETDAQPPSDDRADSGQ